jgi:hypothetical protein
MLNSYISKAHLDVNAEQQRASATWKAAVSNPCGRRITAPLIRSTASSNDVAPVLPMARQVWAHARKQFPESLDDGDERSGIYEKRLQAWQQHIRSNGSSWNRWAPLLLDKCHAGMPRHWAPCLKVPGTEVLAAYELLYPGERGTSIDTN